jgi:hypothetical protein
MRHSPLGNAGCPSPAPHRSPHWRVPEFLVLFHLPKHQRAAAHIAAPNEIIWEEQSIPEDRQETIHVFPRGHAAEENELTSPCFRE